MGKSLSEMTLEELWQLFPIVLKEHDDRYALWYREAETEIKHCLGSLDEMVLSHIGSTAVPGLLAKPIVDILLEISETADPENYKRRLIQAGWLCMSEQAEPVLRISFNRGYTPEGFADRVYHLHLRRRGDHNELYFRDYLRTHSEAAEEYAKLKRRLFPTYEHDRDGYTQAKTEFVERYTVEAKRIFAGRYEDYGREEDPVEK